MTEEYDVFGGLDELCSKNLLANFKRTAPTMENNSDDDLSILEGLENSISQVHESTQKEKNLEIAKAVTYSESSKSSKQSHQNNSMTCSKTCSPLPTASNSKPPTPTKQIEKDGELRVTRSMIRQMRSSMKPQCEPQPAVASNRGRKKQAQSRRQRAEPRPPPNSLEHASGVTETNLVQRSQGRRELMALIAAQSTDVSYVDLISSPVPRIEGVVVVDSDEERVDDRKHTAEKKECSLDLSFDEENPEISVKIMWNGNPEVFKLRKHQKFAHIFATIAKREGTEEKNLVFNINNKILTPNDTPASINYKIFEFINGRVFVSRCSLPSADEKQKRDKNKISLKIQSDQWKRPLQVELLKTDKLKILYIKCAEELSIPYENLKLSFDGEPLEFNDTPADLDLEGGEAIDLRIKK